MSLRAARLCLVAVLALAGFWLLSQLTVATWLAQVAEQREQDWARGISPWHWDFSDPASVVRSGSEGLAAASVSRDGLSVTVPASGAINLSLALADDWADRSALDRLQLELDSDAALQLMLLSLQPQRAWLLQPLPGGSHSLEAPLAAGPIAPTPALLLRIEAAAGTDVSLRRTALLGPACGSTMDCAKWRTKAPPAPTPERLLAWRDAQRALAPAVATEAGGYFGRMASRLARQLPNDATALWIVLALGPLGLLLDAVRQRLLRRPRPGPSARRAGLELVLALGPAVLLLLAGWPARHTPWGIALLMAAGPLALLLAPLPQSRQWRWVGSRAAWRAALAFTLVAALLSWPLGLVPRPAAPPPTIWPYPAWALVQQWLLLAAIVPRLRQIWPSTSAAAVAGGVIFALLHAPNFGLMVFTFIGGTAWAWLGQKHRALLPLAASHTALGLWLLHLAPPLLLRSAEIGGRYLMMP